MRKKKETNRAGKNRFVLQYNLLMFIIAYHEEGDGRRERRGGRGGRRGGGGEGQVEVGEEGQGDLSGGNKFIIHNT
jgi:hypothetical protein